MCVCMWVYFCVCLKWTVRFLLTFISLWKTSGTLPRYTGDTNCCMDVTSEFVSWPSCALIPSTTNRNFFFSKLNMTYKSFTIYTKMTHELKSFVKWVILEQWLDMSPLTECHFPSLYFSLLKISFSLPTDSLILPLDMYNARWARPPLVAAKKSKPSGPRVLISREKWGLKRIKRAYLVFVYVELLITKIKPKHSRWMFHVYAWRG